GLPTRLEEKISRQAVQPPEQKSRRVAELEFLGGLHVAFRPVAFQSSPLVTPRSLRKSLTASTDRGAGDTKAHLADGVATRDQFITRRDRPHAFRRARQDDVPWVKRIDRRRQFNEFGNIHGDLGGGRVLAPGP